MRATWRWRVGLFFGGAASILSLAVACGGGGSSGDSAAEAEAGAGGSRDGSSAPGNAAGDGAAGFGGDGAAGEAGDEEDSGVPGSPGDAGDASAGGEAGSDASADAGRSDGDADAGAGCENLSPAATPAGNLATVNACLASEGKAYFAAGTFQFPTGILVPAGAVMKAVDSAHPPTLQLVTETTKTNYFLKVNGDGIALSYLRIDGNSSIAFTTAAATVLVVANNARLDHLEIFNNTQVVKTYPAAAIYLFGSSSSGNLVTNSILYNHVNGAIFRPDYTSARTNRLDTVTIHDTLCDAVNFAGYGEVVNSTIFDVGWDCNNQDPTSGLPIPAAAFFSVGNPNGAIIENNVAHDTCGNVLDIDRGARFTITGNTFYDPGFQFNGAQPQCGGAFAGSFLDSSSSTITNNSFKNDNRTQNTDFDSAQTSHAIGAPQFSDYPAGSKTSVAFSLGVRNPPEQPSSGAYASAGNTLSGNHFESTQTAAGYQGLGLFTSRGTGYDTAGNWSLSTTNKLTGNVSLGSNVGSVRCGLDWFAGSSTCASGSAAPCNDDDYAHTAGAYHTDNCDSY